MPAYFFRHIRHRHAVNPVKARRRALRTAANGVAPGDRMVLPAGAKILAAMWRLFRR